MRDEDTKYYYGYKTEMFCDIHGYTKFIYRGSPKLRCSKCVSFRSLQQRKEKKDTLLKIHGEKCSICSYDKCKAALEFHHIDPSIKEFRISRLNYSLEKLHNEASKCIVLCANCHAELETNILKNKSEIYYSKREPEQLFLPLWES
jgi:hypothetical protein